MDKWEYKTLKFDGKGFFKSKFEFEEELNKLGNEGWELVSMLSPVSAYGSTTELFAIFKRKK